VAIGGRAAAAIASSGRRNEAGNVVDLYGRRMPLSENSATNSTGHPPHQFRAMARFRDIKTLQIFASTHASIFNHFN
jgi:hypothetical protein